MVVTRCSADARRGIVRVRRDLAAARARLPLRAAHRIASTASVSAHCRLRCGSPPTRTMRFVVRTLKPSSLARRRAKSRASASVSAVTVTVYSEVMPQPPFDQR
jgi:hypothetical protein